MATQQITSTLEEINEQIDPFIKALLLENVDKRNKDLVHYQISSGGKRIRPALAICASRMCGGNDADVFYGAAALEILHNYTLIIDDIMDHSDFRRNIPTVWKKYGKSTAECISMYYAAAIFEGAAKCRNSNEVVKLLGLALKKIVDGQIEDVLFEGRGREDEPYIVEKRYAVIKQEDYFRMVGEKTASLLSASCKLGGVCADASHDQQVALANFGFRIGLAFQIQDDILDTFGDEKAFGKKIGKDIEEGKRGNIVILLAQEQFDKETKFNFSKIFSKEKISEGEIKEVVQMIASTSAKEKAQKLAKKYVTEAMRYLDELPQNEWNDSLRELAEYIIERDK